MENDYKMVIVMRNDLNMRKGKMIAQGGHAVQLVLESIQQDRSEAKQNTLRYWRQHCGYKKVCLQCGSKEELLEIAKQAQDVGLPFAIVVDSGKTEFNGVPTETCIAIGPAISGSIDPITGKLKLL